MLKDLKLKQNEFGVYDFYFENGDFALESGLETAIIVSLFSDKRDDEATDWKNKGGWVGNQLNDNGFEIGSLIWTLNRSNDDSETEILLEDYTRDALQWLLDNNYAKEIDVSIIKNLEGFIINITITNNNNIKENLAFDLFKQTLINE